MVRWLLNTFPSPVLFFAIVAATCGLGAAVEAIQHRKSRTERHSNEMLGIAVEFVGIAYAILIGFVIVALWEVQSDVAETSDAEAAVLRDVAILATGLPTPDEARILDALEAYGREVIDKEWSLLSDGSDDPLAETRAREIMSAIVAGDRTDDLHASLQDTMIDAFTDFYNLRTHRVSLAESSLARELWLLVLLSSAALIVLVAGFDSEQGKWDVGATMIIAGTIGVVLFAMVSLSYPYSGDVSVSPDAFEHMLRAIAA